MNNITSIIMANHSRIKVEEWSKQGSALEFNNANNQRIVSLKEKPKYTYYSNGGIYLLKKTLINRIPKDTFYNATDLIEQLISEDKFVKTYPLVDYWLDIGNHDDFNKAQADVHRIKF